MGLKIGDVRIDSPVFLAPMAAVNCLPFRVLCRRNGAGLIYSQMINVDDFFGQKEAIMERYADFVPEERPVAAQIIGANPLRMAEAAAFLQDHAEIIDINFGCCDSDQLGKKAGCYFIKHPDQLEKMVRAVVGAVRIPVTAKIRIGWDDQSINAVKVARIIEDAGASAIAVHGRTRTQGYTGKANWTAIKQVKEAVKIPVIGNGDVDSPETAKAMFDRTGCDAVMVGRAAMGEPYLFKRINRYLSDGRLLPYQTVDERYSDFKQFIDLYGKQQRQRFSEIRNHALWFCKALPGAREKKNEILKCEDVESIKKIFIKWGHGTKKSD